VDVGDDRHLGFADDGTQRLGAGDVGAGYPDDVRARLLAAAVALASLVGVLVIVWTVTGASPPTATLPTMI
jgi:hypothetical protein